MPAATPLKRPVKVARLIRRRLKELGRTPSELAQAARVPDIYIKDLLAGRRLPPAPGQTDLYDRMTRFLKLHRSDLPGCARAEREPTVDARRGKALDPQVRTWLLDLCEPTRARVLARRLWRRDSTDLGRVIVQRLLEVAQAFVRRQLEDEAGMRVAARRDGCSYADARLRLLDFLDTSADTVTARQHDEFVRPYVAWWDIDPDTHVMKIVLRAHEPAARPRRAVAL